MKQFIFLFALLVRSMITTAQVDIPPVGFNIKASISEEVGITAITINYSRPGVKGREGKIWGNVVPYGFTTTSFITNKNTSPWRAGANEATTISFEHDVKVEGHDLAAGTYALFMAMEPGSSTLIFSKEKEAWGSFYYRPEDDVLRVKVKVDILDKNVEWLKYEFIKHTENSCVVAMQWERLSVPFKVEVDVDKIVLARLREQLTGVKGFISANLLQASMYCFLKNINMEEAMGWALRSVTGQPMAQTGYDAYRNLAMGYEKLGNGVQADSVMNVGLTIANLGQYASYGRTMLKQKRMDRAIEVLMDARKKFGDVYVVNNGLSYAYSAKADFAKAISYAKRALDQAPSQQATTTINHNIQKLKEGKDIN